MNATLQSPPRLRARYPGEFIAAMVRDRLGTFERMAAHGDVVQVNAGRQRLVLVSNPEDIKSVLVTNSRDFRKGRGIERTKILLGEGLLGSEGEFHRRQRRLVQPAFHRARLGAYAEVMVRYADELTRWWTDGATVDVHAEMMRLTLAIAARTLFDADIETEARDVAEVINLSLRLFRFATLPFGEHIERIPLPIVRHMQRARARMDEFIYAMIRRRRESDADHGDLLSMLLVASEDGEGMSDRQIRDEVMTILMAGHETTAVALSWTWYLLSQNPDVATMLSAEIDDVLGARKATIDDVAKLPYTRAVVAESMRLYPPAWVIGRRAHTDVTIGGYAVSADTIVLMSQYIVHRDPRWYAEPELFRPARWTGEGDKKDDGARPKFAYFPFGGGPRVCIGEQFAWTEAVLVLATIARRWRLTHDPARQVVLEPLVTLRPNGGMQMRLARRGGRHPY